MEKRLKDLIPQGHQLIRDNIRGKGNLFGAPMKARVEWARGLDLPSRGEKIFFAGCGYQLMRHAEAMLGAVRSLEKRGLTADRLVSFTKAFRRVGVDLTSVYSKITVMGKEDLYTAALINTVQVLRKVGVDVAYLYEQEPCCGSPMYYSGFEEDFAENAKKTYAQLKNLGVKTVIGLVPACTNALRNLYPKYIDNYDLEVKHFTEAVLEQLKTGEIPLNLKEKLTVTFHDPCQLARYLEITEEPREIMKRIGGLELREVEWTNRKWTTCCGGGGGFEVVYPELSMMVAANRLRELLETGASTIVTSCPGCVIQLTEAAKELKSNVNILDLAQVLGRALQVG